MVLVSYSGKEINAKLVYYGPGLSGKTTNLEYIYGSIPQTHRGKMVSMKTKTERTLFFDFLPVNLGELAGFKTRFLLYTVPGQVYYNATRKLVLKGVDAVVFVADSKRGKMDENVESLENLKENLREHGLNIDDLPWVIQYNKRDLPDAYSVDELERVLNPSRVPYYEAVATNGQGVVDTFKAVSKLLLRKLSKEIGVPTSSSGSSSSSSAGGSAQGESNAAAMTAEPATPSSRWVPAGASGPTPSLILPTPSGLQQRPTMDTPAPTPSPSPLPSMILPQPTLPSFGGPSTPQGTTGMESTAHSTPPPTGNAMLSIGAASFELGTPSTSTAPTDSPKPDGFGLTRGAASFEIGGAGAGPSGVPSRDDSSANLSVAERLRRWLSRKDQGEEGGMDPSASLNPVTPEPMMPVGPVGPDGHPVATPEAPPIVESWVLGAPPAATPQMHSGQMHAVPMPSVMPESQPSARPTPTPPSSSFELVDATGPMRTAPAPSGEFRTHVAPAVGTSASAPREITMELELRPEDLRTGVVLKLALRLAEDEQSGPQVRRAA